MIFLADLKLFFSSFGARLSTAVARIVFVASRLGTHVYRAHIYSSRQKNRKKSKQVTIFTHIFVIYDVRYHPPRNKHQVHDNGARDDDGIFAAGVKKTDTKAAFQMSWGVSRTHLLRFCSL